MKSKDIHEISLDNGFRALLLPRRGLPVVASTLWYAVGSRDERTGESGLSHFLEHMMFKGTDRYAKGEIDLLTSKLGGSNNAFTSHDVTAYYFALAADRWETALEIEASRMQHCLLDETEFAAEKNVVLEELSMGEDDPWNRLWQTTESLCFQVHPYHHPVIGWREDLERLSRETMLGYYRRHYGPNRAFLVAVGDLDVGRTEARVFELFADLPQAEARDSVLAEPAARGSRRAVEYYPQQADVARLTIAVPTCRMGEADDFALDVLLHVLGVGKTSRLYRRLVLEEEVATQVWLSNDVRLDPGVFGISVELAEGQSPERAEAMVREEVHRLAAQGPTMAELRRARTQLRSSFLFEEETVLDVALRIGRFESTCAGGHRLLDDVLQRYEAVKAAEVKDVLQRYLRDQRWNVVWLLPDRNGAPAKPPRRRTRKKTPRRPRRRAGARR